MRLSFRVAKDASIAEPGKNKKPSFLNNALFTLVQKPFVIVI